MNEKTVDIELPEAVVKAAMASGIVTYDHDAGVYTLTELGARVTDDYLRSVRARLEDGA